MILKRRVALVTGGSKRVGAAIAQALARRGMNIAITYRRSAREAKRTADSLARQGVRAITLRVDQSQASEVRHAVEAIKKEFGRLDVLVNSASNFERVAFEELTEQHWDYALDTNLKGPFLWALYASRLMRARGGKIINLADWAGVRPYRDFLPYCVSKSGVIGLTKALAKELAPKIQVVAIAPGPILPPPDMPASQRKQVARRVPLKRWGSPQDIANTALFLLEGTDFMTGSVVFVDGGQLIA